MRFFSLIFAMSLLTVCVSAAHADSLKEKLSKLSVLPLHYGVNMLQVGNYDVMIVRGGIYTGTAWGHDTYTVLERQVEPAKPVWQYARLNDSIGGILVETQPHTDEDSLVSIRFMVSQGEEKGTKLTNLYLFSSARKEASSPVEPTSPVFTLSMLTPPDETGALSFHVLEKMPLKKTYCNADWPAYEVLGVPLPEGGKEEYSCR